MGEALLPGTRPPEQPDDPAPARLALACRLAAQGRARAAWRHGAAVLALLHARLQAGRLLEASRWLDAVRRLAEALLAHAGRPGTAMALAGLAAALGEPPLRAHPIGAEQIDELRAALDAAWAFRVAPAFAQAWVRHALDAIAWLLGESDPAWLQRHAAALGALVEQARCVVVRQDDALLAADWFLATRALRAQRDALAPSGDARVQELAALLRRRGRLEEVLLGQPRGAARAPGADQWCALRVRSETLREQAVRDGLLPPRLRAGAAALAQGLRPHSGLVLACRPGAGQAVLISLRRPDSDGCCAESVELDLPAELAAFRAEELVAMARHAIIGTARGRTLRRAAERVQAPRETPPETPPTADLAAFASALLRRLAERLAEPIAAWVRRFDWHDWAIVPSDDLHLVPWPTRAGAGAVYPSVGAWLRRQGDPPDAPRPLRWACAAHGAGGAGSGGADMPALRWVGIERRLCERLWRGAGQAAVPVDAADRGVDGIDAFVAMGHGSAPQRNPARAGLALDDGAVLTAHDLPALQRSRSVVLSCCVLGQTRDAFGEPLGFLSAAFKYDARFGSGWLTEVPDREACLFGVAFQHALLRAGGAPWSAVFDATRSAIAAGRWPDGFGAWLRDNLPRDAPGVALDGLEAPPASLRRLMPWAVCLGR